jgi:hypothetical protein
MSPHSLCGLEPLHLLAFDSLRPAEAYHHGGRCPNHSNDEKHVHHAKYWEVLDLGQPLDSYRVIHRVVGGLDHGIENQGVRQRPEDDRAQRRDPRHHGDRQPAMGEQPSVGEEQGQVDQGERDEEVPLPVLGPRAEDGECVGPTLGSHHVGGVGPACV